MIVIITVIVIILGSILAKYLFNKDIIPKSWDVFKAFEEKEKATPLSKTADVVRMDKSTYQYNIQPNNDIDIPMTVRTSPELQPMIS